MKSSFRITALATLVAALALLTPAMHAQTTLTVRVNVPFAFDYGTTHFAPGAYTLTMDSADSLIVRGTRVGAIANVETAMDSTRPGTSQAIFSKYGDRYFLEEVVIANGKHITVNESNAERRAANREFVMSGSKPSQVALTLVPERAFGN